MRGIKARSAVFPAMLPAILGLFAFPVILPALWIAGVLSPRWAGMVFLGLYVIVSRRHLVTAVLYVWQLISGRESVYLSEGSIVFVSKVAISVALRDITYIETIASNSKVEGAYIHLRSGERKVVLTGLFEGGAISVARLASVELRSGG